MTFGKEVDGVELIEGRGRGLMNGGDDYQLTYQSPIARSTRKTHVVTLRNDLQVRHNLVRCHTVKSSRRLVEEQNLWRGDQLTGDRDSSLLTTRETLLNRCTDEGVGVVGQAE
jgi:hypothetical protein